MKSSLKNKFWKVLIFDILFIIIFVALFFFIRKNLIIYAGSLQIIQDNLENIGTSNLEEANALLSSLQKSADKAFVYTFILTPILFFIVYVILQGLSWKIIKKRNNIYFLKFALISIPTYVFLILFSIESFSNILYGILTFIFGYFTFVFYINPEFDFVLKSLKRIYLFLPFYFLFMVLYSIFLFSGFLAFISILIGNYSTIIPFALLMTLMFSFYKMILVEKFG